MLLWRYFPSVSSRQGSSNWVGRENHRVQPNILASVGIPASLQCHQIREPTVWQGSLILAQQFSCLLPMVPIPVVWSTADYVHLFFCPLFFFFLVALCGRQDLSSPARSHTYALCSGTVKSKPLDHQGSPYLSTLYRYTLIICDPPDIVLNDGNTLRKKETKSLP